MFTVWWTWGFSDGEPLAARSIPGVSNHAKCAHSYSSRVRCWAYGIVTNCAYMKLVHACKAAWEARAQRTTKAPLSWRIHVLDALL